MADNLLHNGFSATCPHGGLVIAVQMSSRVRLSGQYALRKSDQCLVAGCTFTTPANKPQPCLTVPCESAANRVRIEGQPATLSTSFGECKSAEGIPQGKPIVASSQTRVRGQ